MRKFLILFWALVITPLVANEAIPEDLRVTTIALQAADLMKKVEGKGLLEITEDLLKSEDIEKETKEKIKASNRRIVLFEYPSEGLMVKGYVSFVPSCKDKPLLVFLRGGAEYVNLKHPANSTSFIEDYTVLSTTYRGGVSPGRDEFGGRDVNDVDALIDFIPTLEKKLEASFSANKKYLLGWSRGGMEMFLALSRFPKLQNYFDKAVSMSGLLDLPEFLKNRPDMGKMLEQGLGFPLKGEALKMRNPIDQISTLTTALPILILQGTKDKIIMVKEGREMIKALKKKGMSVDYIEIEGGNHCLENIPNSLKLVSDWLEKEEKMEKESA
ncbi:MAG: hypothetical protein KR126chlam1_00777 [Chlamydiae bacterium]|nr:hypothetical protein [Chlamydiota bacterium]